MRDFRAGHDIRIGGSVHITELSNQPKELAQWTNDELYVERQNREQRLSGERRRKIKFTAIIFLGVELVAGGLGLLFYLKGNANFSSLILALGSLLAALLSMQYFCEPNDVQKRHKNTLREIDLILRERGIK